MEEAQALASQREAAGKAAEQERAAARAAEEAAGREAAAARKAQASAERAVADLEAANIGDADVVYGALPRFLTAEVLARYDIISLVTASVCRQQG